MSRFVKKVAENHDRVSDEELLLLSHSSEFAYPGTLP
jgi:hypothetical protein